MTTDAIAKAFGVEVVVDPQAVAAMRKRFSEQELTPARLRMARIPKGAALIDNAISRAPGFMIENVIVMAGVPRIMQVMLDAVEPRLAKGRPMLSRSVRIDVAGRRRRPRSSRAAGGASRRADRQLSVLGEQAARHLCRDAQHRREASSPPRKMGCGYLLRKEGFAAAAADDE